MIFIIPTDTCFWIGCWLWDIEDYQRIYTIKKRPLEKPLAIMVESFDWLYQYTSLNEEQIEYLQNYKRPFTVLCDCPRIQMLLQMDQEDFSYPNKEVYQKIAFRVAHNDIQKKLIHDIGPIFLTSANFSGEKEIYDIQEARMQFQKFEKEIEFLWENITLDSNIKPSDIIEFIGETTEIVYQRQN